MKSPDIAVACTLTLEQLDERRNTVLLRVGSAILETQEREQGFAYRFAPDRLEDVARIISLERKCCAFLRFTLTVEPGNGPLWLEVSGPAGTKEFLASFWE